MGLRVCSSPRVGWGSLYGFLCRVYGLAIMVYQKGYLNWLGFAALSNHGTEGALW